MNRSRLNNIVLILCLLYSPANVAFAEEVDNVILTQEETIVSERGLFVKGQHYLEIGDVVSAEQTYEKILSLFPSSPALDTALYRLSDLSISEKQFSKAVGFLEKLIHGYPASSMTRDARYKLAMLYYETGRFSDALPLLEGAAKGKAIFGDKLIVLTRLADIYTSESYVKESLISAVATLLKMKEISEAGDEIDERVKGLVAEGSEKQLFEIIEIYPKKFPGDEALIKLINGYMASGNYFSAERNIKSFLANYRRHPFRSEAFKKLDQIEIDLKSKKFLVAVGIHSSDEFKVFGSSILKGIYLAYDEVADREDYLGLLIKDFRKDNLFAPVNEITKKYRPIAMIGPMLSSEVTKVGGIIRRFGIPMISPAAGSTNVGKKNDHFFRVAMTNNEMIKRLVEFARNELEVSKFAVLRPTGRYYHNLGQSFKSEVEKTGGSVVLERTYAESLNDYSSVIKEFIRADLRLEGEKILESELKKREDEAAGIIVELPKEVLEGEDATKLAEESKVKKKEDKLLYLPGFDALFLPGEDDSVSRLVPQLAFFDIDKRYVQLLGDNSWSSLAIVKKRKKFAVGAVFVDGFFAESRRLEISDFVEKFRVKYGSEPDIFAAQGYDSMKIIIDALEQGIDNRGDLRNYLAGLKDYNGVTGKLSLKENGIIEKDLFILNVKKRRIVEMEKTYKFFDIPTAKESEISESMVFQ